MGENMKMFLVLSFVFSFLQVSASELKIKKVSELGPMNHQVIFQSENLKPTKKKNEFTGLVVLKWGVYVFETVSATYKCSSKNVCSITSYERVQTFESCIVKNNKVKCSKPLSEASNSTDSSGGSTDTSSPDLIVDEFDNDRNDSSESDFPERSSDEYGDLF